MAEPTLALTFQDFLIRVAEYLGVAYYGASGDEAAQVPTDAHDLDVCKRLVNDGYRRFFNSNPSWNWVNLIFTITLDSEGTSDRIVNGEKWRYYMPDGFYGQMLGPITYAENEGHISLVEVPDWKIRQQRAVADSNGYPTLYALRPLSGDDARRWELIVWPEPYSDDVLTGRCRIYPNKLTELTDKPNCGFQFDEAVLAACLAEAESARNDTQGLMESKWAEALVRAIAVDQKTAPSRLGDYGGSRTSMSRHYTGVDTYTNQDGTVHSFEI